MKLTLAFIAVASLLALGGCSSGGGDVGYGGEVKTAPAGAGVGKATPSGTTAGKPPPASPE